MAHVRRRDRDRPASRDGSRQPIGARPRDRAPSAPRRGLRDGAGALLVVCALALPAHAERAVHGSIGGGSTLLLTGHDDNRLRYELAFDLEPKSRYGGFIAWRAFDGEHRGMVLGGVVFEGAAARPRLVVDLHGDVGADLDQRAPVLGGGIRTTLTLWGPLGIALDAGAYLVLDGIDDTRLRLLGSTSIVARW